MNKYKLRSSDLGIADAQRMDSPVRAARVPELRLGAGWNSGVDCGSLERLLSALR
jgi:hypothetical protein